VTTDDLADLSPVCVHVVPTWGPAHDTESGSCWCNPTEEPGERGDILIVHREPPS
jgi:hypothetical protein